VRPLLPFEAAAGAHDIITVTRPSQISLPQLRIGSTGGAGAGDVGTYSFGFDRVYRADGPAASQQMHQEMVRNGERGGGLAGVV